MGTAQIEPTMIVVELDRCPTGAACLRANPHGLRDDNQNRFSGLSDVATGARSG